MENAQEKDRKCIHWKMTEKQTQKMKELEMHDVEKSKNSHPENERLENAQPENDRKITTQKMTEMAHPKNERIENARHGK